tara:strand:- start:105 stop:872 length:768 start_codon:yes stop_codon:yes gene_type:complete
MKKPNILITNDDGIFSSGIYALWEVVKSISKTIIVAPKSQQSAKSHAITISKLLRVNHVKKSNGFEGWGVSGTPVDSVKIGLESIVDVKPDLLISGINKGANVGNNIIYSGTVSAAREGVINGIPSIALSLNSFKTKNFECAKKVALKIINFVLDNKLPKGILLNINIPNCGLDELKGFIITEQGNQYFKDKFEKRYDPRKNHYYWLDGEIIDKDKDLRFDGYAIENNFVSITPLRYNLTDFSYMKILKKDFKIE